MKTITFLLLLAVFMCVTVFAVSAQDEKTTTYPVTTEIQTIRVPEGIITIKEVEYVSASDDTDTTGVDSQTIFSDDLYQTCSSGARFDFTASGPGEGLWVLNWSSGWQGNDPYCSSSQCSYTITTDWSAYYTNAAASVNSPQTVWGPSNAYRCR